MSTIIHFSSLWIKTGVQKISIFFVVSQRDTLTKLEKIRFCLRLLETTMLFMQTCNNWKQKAKNVKQKSSWLLKFINAPLGFWGFLTLRQNQKINSANSATLQSSSCTAVPWLHVAGSIIETPECDPHLLWLISVSPLGCIYISNQPSPNPGDAWRLIKRSNCSFSSSKFFDELLVLNLHYPLSYSCTKCPTHPPTPNHPPTGLWLTFLLLLTFH